MYACTVCIAVTLLECNNELVNAHHALARKKRQNISARGNELEKCNAKKKKA
jgi:hypothetical protein